MKVTEISPEMKIRIIQAAKRTFDAVGSDLLQCVADNEGLANAEQAEMSQAEVIECVADADRMDMYGDDKEAYAEFKKLDWEEMDELLKEAFPHKTYGF